MAISVGNTSSVAGSGTSVSVSHVIAAGSSKGLITYIFTPNTITSVIFNTSQTMTQIASQAATAGYGGTYNMYLFFLPAPTVTTANVVVNSVGAGIVNIANADYSGIQQSTTVDSSGSASTSGTTFTMSTTVVASNCWLFGAFELETGGSSSAGSGTILRQNASNAGLLLLDSNATVGTGSQSLKYNTPNGPNAGCLVSLAPAGAAAVNSKFLMFM